MSKFLIEVPHDPDEQTCLRVVDKFLESGSHLLKHADWGCKSGVHKSWIMVELGSKDEARYILPPAFRAAATVTELNQFTSEEIRQALKK